MGILPGSWVPSIIGTPSGVAFETWAGFIDITGVVLIFMVVIFFLLFSSRVKSISLACRLARLEKPKDVFKLRNPWIYGLWFIFLAQLFIGAVLILLILPKDFSAIAGAVVLVTLEGVIGMFLYWLITLFPILPKRIQYAPFAKVIIHAIMGRKR